MQILAWAVALFFAINIGASGTAASMGSAYGAGAVKRRWIALVLVAVAVFLGAYLGGGDVVKTISGGIIPSHLITLGLTVVIITAAGSTLFLANLLSVPLSTSEVTVGSLVGVGLAYQTLFLGKLFFLLAVWLVFPFLSYGIAFLLGKVVRPTEAKLANLRPQRTITAILTFFLIAAGCYEAFSAGMNNVANAVGPLVAAGVVHVNQGLFLGALFVALGAIALGGRVLETNAKKITKISLLQGTVVSLTSGTLVIASSVFGLPVPLTQATTMAIMGVGSAKMGRGLWKQGIVKRVVLIWFTSPVSSLVISYLLVRIFVKTDIYSVVAIFSAFAMVVGFVLFLRGNRRAKAAHPEAATPSKPSSAK